MGSENIWHGKHRIDITKYDPAEDMTGRLRVQVAPSPAAC
jgi:hypothetical protein